MNDQWRQQLREKMADYRRPAPEVSWDEIDRALDARKSRLLWWRSMAAAAVLLLIAGAGYWGRQRLMGQQGNAPQEVTSEANLQKAVPDIIELPSVLDVAAHHGGASVRSPLVRLQAENTQLCESEERVLDIPPSNQGTFLPDSTPTETEVQPRIAEKHESSSVRHTQVFYPSDLRQRNSSDSRLTAKVYMSNTMNNSYRTESFAQRVTNTTIKSYDIPVDPSEIDASDKEWKDNPVEPLPDHITVYDTITVVQTQKTDRHIRHHQPVRFGLSLRYRIDDHWSVESGLSYTRLVSDITTVTDGQVSVSEQRLNYLGLPVNIGYMLWTNRHFGLYVTAGGTIEKMLDASPWQFSFNGAVGAEYKLTNVFSLYAEPGVGYYFSNGSTMPTIYQDHPFNFNLSFGLRLNLK
jgi:hypothetical protein